MGRIRPSYLSVMSSVVETSGYGRIPTVRIQIPPLGCASVGMTNEQIRSLTIDEGLLLCVLCGNDSSCVVRRAYIVY